MQSARNVTFIVGLYARGLTPDQIYGRILERLVWDGMYPSVDEIKRICGERERAVS